LSVEAEPADAFVIADTAVVFRITFLSLQQLNPHEDTIGSEVESLKRAILSERRVRDPIIVDQQTSVVLDGMHRLAAMHSLEARRIPVCQVDYQNPAIQLKRWFRVISNTDEAKIRTFASAILRQRFHEEKLHGNSGSIREGILISDDTIITPQAADVFKRLELLSGIEKALRDNGANVSYADEREALEQLRKGGARGVIAFPLLTKADVVRAALERRVLPHKTTRHVIPARPMHVNAPLDLLMDSSVTDLDANRLLVGSLRERFLKRLGPGASVDGRAYEEGIYLIVDGQ
jgi:hypothetical protein